MKFSNKYHFGAKIKKQNHPDYWLSAEKNKRSAKSNFRKNQNVIVPAKNNNMMQNQNVQLQQNTVKKPIVNANVQPYTGIDKNFQFNNNMMNMYRAAVNNSQKK